VHYGYRILAKDLLALGALALLFAGLAGCSAQQKEISRQTSPNQNESLVSAVGYRGGSAEFD
jgi:hypothetical protein